MTKHKYAGWSLFDNDAPGFDVGRYYDQDYDERVMPMVIDREAAAGEMLDKVEALPADEIVIVNTPAGAGQGGLFADFWAGLAERRRVFAWVLDRSSDPVDFLAEAHEVLAGAVDKWVIVKNLRGRANASEFTYWDASKIRATLAGYGPEKFCEIELPSLHETTARLWVAASTRSRKIINAVSRFEAPGVVIPRAHIMILKTWREAVDTQWEKASLKPGDIVVSSGGKGGVGKSTACRSLIDYVSERSTVN